MAIRVITNPSKAQITRNAKEGAVLVLTEDGSSVEEAANKSGKDWYLTGDSEEYTVSEILEDYGVLALFYNDGK